MEARNEIHRVSNFLYLDPKTFVYTSLMAGVVIDGNGKAVSHFDTSKVETFFPHFTERAVDDILDSLVKEGRIVIQKNGKIVVGEYGKNGKLLPFTGITSAAFTIYAKKTLTDSLRNYGRMSEKAFSEAEEWKEIFSKYVFENTAKILTDIGIAQVFTILFKMYTGGIEQSFTVAECQMFKALCKRYGWEIGADILIEGILNAEKYFTKEPTISIVCSKEISAKIVSFVNADIVEERDEERGSRIVKLS